MDIIEISPIEQYVIDVVREKRKERKMSQRDLADEMEISHGFVAAAESTKERAKYNLAHINTFAKIFNCSPQEFLPGNAL